MRIDFAVSKLLKCLLLIFWFDLESSEGVKKKRKKIRLLLPFERSRVAEPEPPFLSRSRHQVAAPAPANSGRQIYSVLLSHHVITDK